jgi:hypothetical protein
MKFQVQWEDDVLATLAALWMSASDRAKVTHAQAVIDRVLASDPIRKGISLSEGIHAIEFDPLRVLYEINESARLVDVVAVKRIPKSDSQDAT